MCYDDDAHPPIDTAPRTVAHAGRRIPTSAGTRFAAYTARPAQASGAGVVVLPDNRGLRGFYEDLAVRLAEQGHPAVAIDYFGHTDGIRRDRGENFDPLPHLLRLTPGGVYGDIGAAAGWLRAPDGGDCAGVTCLGGRFSFLSARTGLGLGFDGVIGFYGATGPLNATPGPTQVAAELAGPVLGIFGGADEHLSPSMVEAFDQALDAAGVAHQVVTYPGAPHSFFDINQHDHAAACADAWDRVLGFLHTVGTGGTAPG